jgi:hypothetical protein
VTADMVSPARRIAATLGPRARSKPWIVYGGDSIQWRGDVTLLPWRQTSEVTAGG